MASPIHYLEAVALDSTSDMIEASLAGMVSMLHTCEATETLVYPNLTDGTTVVSANADWTLGNYAVIVPINTITLQYHVTAVNIETCDRDAVFQVELYQGAGDDLIATVCFSVVGGFFGNSVYRINSEMVPANAQLRARFASSNGAAQIATITMSIRYHTHS